MASVIAIALGGTLGAGVVGLVSHSPLAWLAGFTRDQCITSSLALAGNLNWMVCNTLLWAGWHWLAGSQARQVSELGLQMQGIERLIQVPRFTRRLTHPS